MATPPEVVFDRYFRDELPNWQQALYAGKQDLAAVRPGEFAGLLETIQASVNAVYEKQRVRVLARGRHPDLHFDYVRATIANALAFQYGGLAFVGLTLPLIDEVSRTCELLASSDMVIQALRPETQDQEQRRRLLTVFFATLLQFIACHELGHHFHGHCVDPGGAAAPLREEFVDDNRVSSAGSLYAQAEEVDADGFAVHMMLRNLVAGSPRAKVLELLGRSSDDADDDAILALLVLSAGAFFFGRQGVVFDERELGQLRHPPVAIRMHFVMQELHAWLSAKRPSSASWATVPRYGELMRAASDALGRQTGGLAWDNQTAFLLSDEGRKYLGRLADCRADLTDQMNDRRWELADVGETLP